MQIRRLQRSDYRSVYALMKEFAAYTKWDIFLQEDYDYEHINHLLLRCEKGGVSLVGQDQDQIRGIFLSITVPDLWMPKTLWLREIMWFVEKKYRGTALGARLFLSYQKEAEILRKSGRIQGYTMSKLANSPDFDYEKRGFKFVESTYMIGE